MIEVPDQQTSATQPSLDAEITALFHTAGITAIWNGYMWSVKGPRGKWYAVGQNVQTFDDWRAIIDSVLSAP